MKRRDGALFAKLDDELLAIDAQQAFLYSLNESGGRIWVAVEKPTSVRDVCAHLAAVYDVEDETCRRAVVALLDELHEAGFVEIVRA